ncbi:MAG: hypothetical protein R2825_15320 [Saprospiraceae bacterium]|jgi:uncharacterized membrane protein
MTAPANPPITFTNYVGPLFSKWKSQMMWRLDLSKYEDVKMNANIIYNELASGNMPPPNIATLKPEEIAKFKSWIDNGCPE